METQNTPSQTDSAPWKATKQDDAVMAVSVSCDLTSAPSFKPPTEAMEEEYQHSTRQLTPNWHVLKTNNSSIVSKRSVEKLYYPNEPHFFRFFVKKFQRRAPLINRGYFLRMHVIDVLVRNFLSESSTSGQSKRKVVLNLGCGR
jgi:hypothetical protein